MFLFQTAFSCERVTGAERRPGPGCYPDLAGGRFPPAFLQQQDALPLSPVPLAAWVLMSSVAVRRDRVCPLPAAPAAWIQAQRHSQYSREYWTSQYWTSQMGSMSCSGIQARCSPSQRVLKEVIKLLISLIYSNTMNREFKANEIIV